MMNDYLHRIGWFSTNNQNTAKDDSCSDATRTKSPDWHSLNPDEQMSFCNFVYRLRMKNGWESPVKIQWQAFEMVLSDRKRLIF